MPKKPASHVRAAGDRDALLRRLRRIEGQVRGVQRMVEEDRYCPEILVQISAIRESLRSAGALLLNEHLRSCVTGAVRSRDPERTEAVYEELIELFNRYSR
jgi:CsoR family transcriptional regulator, copper-sensing transcriptional repressor